MGRGAALRIVRLMGQWSEPITSSWISASATLPSSDSSTTWKSMRHPMFFCRADCHGAHHV